jgi:hypothetical protein
LWRRPTIPILLEQLEIDFSINRSEISPRLPLFTVEDFVAEAGALVDGMAPSNYLIL